MITVPSSGSGPGVLLLPEFWGLNEQIRDVAARLAEAGFATLLVDLYDGEVAIEREDAFRLSAALTTEHAAAVMSAAVDRALADERFLGPSVGVLGYCLGGGMSLYLSSLRPEVAACVAFYGLLPTEDHPIEPDWSAIRASVLGHIAEHDEYATPEGAARVGAQLDAAGVENRWELYPGCVHAFCNERQPDRFDPEAAALAWDRTVAFLRQHLTGETA